MVHEMHLKSLELTGFKSFGKKEVLDFNAATSAIVGPNGSGKSNVAEAFRFVLGEQSIKSLRGKKGEDLIFNGGKSAPRANRAAVKVVFDNRSRLFDIDFDDVQIERIVHRDGVNQYFINGTQVRLRDVAELLAEANIGASGHHIISQGEADRLLSASPRERREMVEDALGLRSYQYKLSESERKLDKTQENIGQVEALRKEIAPHLRFLKKQVEKVEKTKELREELIGLYREYLKREEIVLAHETARIAGDQEAPRKELDELERALVEAKAVLEREKSGTAETQEILSLEEELRAAREKREQLLREQARLEGQLSFEERRLQVERRRSEPSDDRMLPLREVRTLVGDLEGHTQRGLATEVLAEAHEVFRVITRTAQGFISAREQVAPAENPELVDVESVVRGLTEEHEALREALRAAEAQEEQIRSRCETARAALEAARVEGREAERQVFTIMTRQSELRVILERLEREAEGLTRRRERFEAELAEGAALLGRAVLSYPDHALSDTAEPVPAEIVSEAALHQEERRRVLERHKIRLEEMDTGSGEEVLKEFQEVEERDQFLMREIEDLEKSANSLRELITELEVKLDRQFKEGITKINKEFQTFFALMFGGGTASLTLVRPERRRTESQEALGMADEPDEEPDEGIDIAISLPHKRIRGLTMLSGGERALTSIALLFAMSQVNPPPFLILDETDAALDEANSRRYGDMIENLARYSQLIVITHNRETMSRAQILYGITMGGDGISKILSVRFDEAVQVAK